MDLLSCEILAIASSTSRQSNSRGALPYAVVFLGLAEKLSPLQSRFHVQLYCSFVHGECRIGVMATAKIHQVKRSDLRQHQAKWLKKARGQNVLLNKSNDAEEEKVVLDRQYFDEIRKQVENL